MHKRLTQHAAFAFGVVLGLSGCGGSQAPTAPAPDPVTPPVARRPSDIPAAEAVTSIGADAKTPEDHPFLAADLLDRVAVVGASASSGFGARVPMDSDDWPLGLPTNFTAVFDSGLAMNGKSTVTHHADLFFFRAPVRYGPRLLQEATATMPTLVLAVDFLFWFGYGSVDRQGEPLFNESARTELLEEGLQLLDGVRCPMVVGDFPDMSPAVGRGMLGASQLPAPETLAALNARLRAWADERPRVRLLPMADFVERVRDGRPLLIATGGRWTPDGPALLQPDELHPTPEGLIALAQLTAVALETDPGLAPGRIRFERDAVLATLRARAR